jgi:hypothetical protein
MPRRLSLAEAMIALSPSLWKRWWALSRRLHREVPSIAIADVETPVACQLFERVDRVMYVRNPKPTAQRMVTRIYLPMAAELFRAGAAGEISAVYYDRQLRRDQPVLREHWTGQVLREAAADTFAWGVGLGWDRSKWHAPGAPIFGAEPVEDLDPLQPDQRLQLKDNALRPWPGLILPAVRVELSDGTPKAPRGRPLTPIWLAVQPDAFAWLDQHGGVPQTEDGRMAFYDHLEDLCRNAPRRYRKRRFERRAVIRNGDRIIAEYKKERGLSC